MNPGAERAIAERIASLPRAERIRYVRSLPRQIALKAIYTWSHWARPKQRLPIPGQIRDGVRVGKWVVWINLGGRGYGKTRVGAETVRGWVEEHPAGVRPLRVGLIAETAGDARDVMVEGESGIMAVSPPWFRPIYEPSKRRLTWVRRGRVVAIGIIRSGAEPEGLRGQQFDKAWVDELAKYRYPDETWDNLELGLRLGPNPQAIVTTTPRPIRLLRKLLADPQTHVTRGTTYENIANLAPAFAERIRRKYEGTRLGRQELLAELLDDIPGALWTRNLLDRTRIRPNKFGQIVLPPMDRIAVALDPSGTANEDSDACGLVVAGRGVNGDGYVWDDLTEVLTPSEWGHRAVTQYHLNEADILVGEGNYGGDMVETIIRMIDDTVNFRKVTASRGKHLRAEPVAALYEQERIHHVGSLPLLEDELVQFTTKGYQSDDSPNRADAAVFALTELMLDNDFDDGAPWAADRPA